MNNVLQAERERMVLDIKVKLQVEILIFVVCYNVLFVCSFQLVLLLPGRSRKYMFSCISVGICSE